MHRQCTAETKSGTRCRARALAGTEWCFTHHPDRQSDLAESRKRGGQARSNAVRATRQWRHLADNLEAEDIPGLLLAAGIAAAQGEMEAKQATALAACARAAFQISEAVLLEQRIRQLELLTSRLEEPHHE